MIYDFEPGDKVFNPANKDWGIGQVQSIIKDKVTVNFQNVGKNFAKEARKAHKGKRDKKFYGTASKEEANKLLKEGIDLFAVPDYKDN